jgi:hypothetical protein
MYAKLKSTILIEFEIALELLLDGTPRAYIVEPESPTDRKGGLKCV